MKKRYLVIVAAVLLSPLLATTSHGQGAAHSNSESERKEENKNEVDHLIDELKSRNQKVYARCIENCDPSTAITGETSGGGIIEKVRPEYPALARAAHASGVVVVQLIVDEEGKVIAAHAISGHPLLQAASVKAARQTTFNPFLLNGEAVKVAGVINYNFVPR